MNFDHFEVNLLPSLIEKYNREFSIDKNIIGVSDLPYGMRKIVIKKCYGIKNKPTMKMIAGHIVEELFQSEPMLSSTIRKINSQLPYDFKYSNDLNFYKIKNGHYILQEVTPEKEKIIEILPNQYLRAHPDIYTSLYAIEIKYTGLHYKDFIKDEYLNRIFHYCIQLNTYLGLFNLKFGFLLIINAGIWSTNSKNFDFVWRNYCRVVPFTFNQELFDITIKRAKELFKYIEKEDFTSPSCPEILWECDPKYCPVIDDCPIKITKKAFDTYQICEHCKEKIRPGIKCLIRCEKTWHYKNEEGIEMEQCITACREYK